MLKGAMHVPVSQPAGEEGRPPLFPGKFPVVTQFKTPTTPSKEKGHGQLRLPRWGRARGKRGARSWYLKRNGSDNDKKSLVRRVDIEPVHGRFATKAKFTVAMTGLAGLALLFISHKGSDSLSGSPRNFNVFGAWPSSRIGDNIIAIDVSVLQQLIF